MRSVHCRYESPQGLMFLLSDGTGVTGVYFAGQKYAPELDRMGEESTRASVLVEARRQLDLYFSGVLQNFVLPLTARGTPFQQDVWKAISSVPYGTTISYGELAKRLGRRSARAVGTAVGRNPISVVIPCHRIVGSNGSLTGYAGGFNRKRALIQLEVRE
jgi:methylated-DNA-[protein]-cysteine S-methyltransferase